VRGSCSTIGVKVNSACSRARSCRKSARNRLRAPQRGAVEYRRQDLIELIGGTTIASALLLASDIAALARAPRPAAS